MKTMEKHRLAVLLVVLAAVLLVSGGLSAQSAVSADWPLGWDGDVDLDAIQSLSDVLAIAFVRDTSMQLSELELKMMLASLAGLQASLRPQLTLSGDYIGQNFANMGGGASRPTVGAPDPEDVVHVVSGSLTYAQQLGPSNQLRGALTQAEIGLELTELQQQRAALDLVAQVQQYYHGILNSYSMFAVAELAKDIAQESLAITENKLLAGTVTPVDVLREKNAVLEAENNVQRAEHGLQISILGLLRLIGLDASYLETGTEWAADLAAQEQFGVEEWVVDFDDMLAFAMDSRLELRSAAKQRRLAEVEYATELGRSDWSARVSGTYEADEFTVRGSLDSDRLLTTTLNRSETRGLPDGLEQAQDVNPWQVNVNVTYRFGDGGAGRAEEERRALAVEQAGLQYVSAEDGVFLDIHNRYFSLQQAYRTYALRKEMLLEAERTFTQMEELYAAGMAVRKDLLDGKLMVAHARSAAQEAALAYWMSQAELARAAGVPLTQVVQGVSSGEWNQISWR